ncbi:MAG: ABC transporter permease [bacterium]|nr:ABC transporter permease [bacterium]MDE0352343.1 ABC transporter permease [bacterium]
MANRVVILAVVLLAVVIIGFTITRSTGTPLYASLGVAVSEAIIEQRAEEMGLNEPIVVQFWTYLTHLLQGDLGVSRISRIPVAEDIAIKLPATAEMVFFTLMVSFIWAIPLGVRAGLRPDGKLARLGEGMAQFGVSVPAFWLGLLFIFLLYFLPPRLPDPLGPLPSLFPPPLGRVGSGVTPPEMVTGLYTLDALIAGDFRLAWHALWHLILPAVTLSLTSGPPLFRVTRSAVSEAVSSPFVEAAYSYGLGRRTVLVRDVLRNASPPVLNLAAMTFGYLIGGGVLVEVVFSWPGIGSFAVWGMDNSDYDVVLAVVIIAAVIYVILYFIVDLIQFAMDPRLRD